MHHIQRFEAGKRSTGTVKRKGSLSSMHNFGYYLDDDSRFIAECEKLVASAEVSEELATSIANAKAALEKESEVSPVEMRNALTRIHSPEAKADAEKESIYKDARSAVFMVRKMVYDDKLSGMVNTLTSKYASNARKIQETATHLVELTRSEMEKAGLEADDVEQLYSATTMSVGVKNKAIGEFYAKCRPYLDKLGALAQATETVVASDLNAILMEMNETLKPIVDDAASVKKTVKTTISSASKDDLAAIANAIDLDAKPESLVAEGIISDFANWISGLAGKIVNKIKSFFGLIDEGSEETNNNNTVMEAALSV